MRLLERPLAVPALILALIAAPALAADEIAVELFDYDPGELDGQDGGEGWADAWRAVIGLARIIDTAGSNLEFEVPDGGVAADEGQALELIGNADEIAYRELAEPESSDEVYISVLFRFDGTVNNNDFLGIWFDEFLGGTHTTVPSIGLKGNQETGVGPLDLFARLSIRAEAYSEDITPGETYLIVGRMSKSVPGEFEPYDQYDLWVNPAFEDDDSPEATSVGIASSQFSIIGIRVPNFGVDDRALIGRFRVGTEWEDVVPPPDAAEARFRRGDVDGSGEVNLSDAVFTLNGLFLAGPSPNCLDATDSDDNGEVNLTDAVFTLNHLFLAGPSLPPPGSLSCGVDPTVDGLSCDDDPACP